MDADQQTQLYVQILNGVLASQDFEIDEQDGRFDALSAADHLFEEVMVMHGERVKEYLAALRKEARLASAAPPVQ